MPLLGVMFALMVPVICAFGLVLGGDVVQHRLKK